MEQLINELTLLDLPSTMWGIHIHPKRKFIGILHVNVSSSKLVIDKGLLLVEEKQGVKPRIFLNGFRTYLPNFALDVKLLSDLSDILYRLHNKDVCINSAFAARYPQCLKLVDKSLNSNMENDTEYCCVCRDTKFEVPAGLPNRVAYNEAKLYNPHEEAPGATQTKPEESKHTRSICNQNFLSDLVLTVHREEHNEQIKKEESTSSRPESDEEKSEDQQSKEKQGLCNVCGKTFAPGYGIKEHMLTHTQTKPFRCKSCNRSFAKAHNLRMHEYTHTGERPYVCSSCGKTYTTSSNLRTHTISCYNEEKKHVCDICRMTFVYPRYLKIHMRTHTGERPFVCSVCGKKFSKNIHLTVHMRTHTGEKPYRCNVCGKGFIAIGGLGYHKKAKHKDSNSL